MWQKTPVYSDTKNQNIKKNAKHNIVNSEVYI